MGKRMPIIAPCTPPLPPLPRIDFEGIAAGMGDLRNRVSADLDDPGRAGKFRCPFHGGGQERTPSMQVWDDHFKCFSCGESGDSLDWVAKRERLTLVQAAKRIDPSIVTAEDVKREREMDDAELAAERRIAAEAARSARPEPTPAPPRPAAPEVWRDPEWQARLSGLVAEAEGNLWSSAGRPALDWLRGRGLSSTTIRRFRLGFLEEDARTGPVAALPEKYGRPRGLFAPRGVTAPWLAPGAWYSEADGEPDGPRWAGMNVRRLADDVRAKLPEGVDKCLAVAGSRRGYLYPWPTIEPTQGILPLLLVEGEFDALVGIQLAGPCLHVATAGSASVRNVPRETRAALAGVPWIFLALDHDGAGAEAARAWREAFPHKARRVLLPHGKDLNEFVVEGGNLLDWLAEVRAGLDRS